MFECSIGIRIPNSFAKQRNLRGVVVDNVVVQFVEVFGAEVAVDALEGSDSMACFEMTVQLITCRVFSAFYALG